MLSVFQHKKNIIALMLALMAIFSFSPAYQAVAQSGIKTNIDKNLEASGKTAGVHTTTKPLLVDIIGAIIQSALVFIGTIFLVLMIYGGYLWMIAHGNQDYVKKGRDIIIQASIGLVLVLASYAVSSFILIRVLRSTTLLSP